MSSLGVSYSSTISFQAKEQLLCKYNKNGICQEKKLFQSYVSGQPLAGHIMLLQRPKVSEILLCLFNSGIYQKYNDGF